MAISTTTIAVIAILLFLVYQLGRIGQRPKGYPPGPPTLPLIGNLHQIPKEKPHLQFQKWAEEYGPVYSLILGTKVMIVLSSDKAIKDLLDKRSTNYSSRADVYLGRIVSGNERMLLMEYGDKWRMIRKLVHNSLNIKAARTYVPYQDLENKAMLKAFLDGPSQFIHHIRRYTNSLSTQMLFGFRTVDNNDPRLKQLFRSFEGFSIVMGSEAAALLEVFPLLRYLPDAFLPMRRYAKELHKVESALFLGHYRETRRKLKAGEAKPCLCVDLVRAQDKEGFSDLTAAYVSGSLLEAGSDTTAATLVGWVQALLLFPEVCIAGQAEVDRVCGDRLPDLNDLPDLPYIRGCMKESMRWMPTVILGVPHAAVQDDEYMGYKIPKGAGMMWNVWAIANDPKRHPDPRRFDPTRWAGDNQTSVEAANNPDASKRDHFLFGAGRRLCQGMHIADRSLFLAMSRLLWAFDFERPIDGSTGKEIIPDIEALVPDGGTFVQPEPFDAVIKPRSEWKAQRVREEWAKATELLDDEMQWRAVPENLIWRDYEPTEVATKA
ncbi:cytochrome P450 [Annulohypoxylon truncatum]|uniref:cytochrome P450 n=1 Tax=Annulohypoxylon truncatum TaxID=327061 RepID=UPI002007DB4B|nr:cytochrome P450 [Annulohypoxylon truncatum]KAI1204660.1 cytochrome P450 [Annulohypoxylon truncatum]